METRKHLLTDSQKNRPMLGGFFVLIQAELKFTKNQSSPINTFIGSNNELDEEVSLMKLKEQKRLE